MSAEEDDLLNLDEIEALLRSAEAEARGASAGSQVPPTVAPPPTVPPSVSGAPALPPGDIDDHPTGPTSRQPAAPAMTRPRPADPPARPAAESGKRDPDELLRQVEADLASVLAGDGPRRGIPPELGSALPFDFPAFDSQGGDRGGVGLDALEDVELDLRIELGRTELLIEEVLQLKEGSVVPLDKLAGDPVDILVNGRLVARGEVLVLNDNFCVRVAEILAPDF